MGIKCTYCDGNIQPKLSKIALVAGGAVAMPHLAAAFGLKSGILALAGAAFQGNQNANQLLRLKMSLMNESSKMGSFFVCGDCGRDASVSEVFNKLTQ